MNFVATHKNFIPPEFVKGDDWNILSKVQADHYYPCKFTTVIYNEWTSLETAYNELYQWRYIYEHTRDEWIGLNQYRRYIEYTPDEIILPKPLYFNMNEQYKSCHNINDLLYCEQIISEYFPEYYMDYNKINYLYPSNIFQASREVFNKWFEFVGGVLNIFSDKKNLHNMEDVRSYVYDRISNYNDKRIDYQIRLHGFLAERLNTIFWIKYTEKHTIKTNPLLTLLPKEETYK